MRIPENSTGPEDSVRALKSPPVSCEFQVGLEDSARIERKEIKHEFILES